MHRKYGSQAIRNAYTMAQGASVLQKSSEAYSVRKFNLQYSMRQDNCSYDASMN
jgi:hypothetical protein